MKGSAFMLSTLLLQALFAGSRAAPAAGALLSTNDVYFTSDSGHQAGVAPGVELAGTPLGDALPAATLQACTQACLERADCDWWTCRQQASAQSLCSRPPRPPAPASNKYRRRRG